jgi:putative ABC transport system permease protein
LAPTGTVIDRLLLTSHESVWLVHETPGDTAAVQNREITAMLVRFKNKLAMMSLPRFVNQQTPMQAALPAIEINRLFSLLGMGIAALRTIAIAIMLLGAVSVFVSMVNSLRERIPEMAMLRSMGASRPQVAAMVLLEAVILALGGAVLGLATSRLGIWLLNTYASSEFGMMVDITRFAKAEAVLVLATTILCTFAAMIPAIKTGRMDISKVLSGHA